LHRGLVQDGLAEFSGLLQHRRIVNGALHNLVIQTGAGIPATCYASPPNTPHSCSKSKWVGFLSAFQRERQSRSGVLASPKSGWIRLGGTIKFRFDFKTKEIRVRKSPATSDSKPCNLFVSFVSFCSSFWLEHAQPWEVAPQVAPINRGYAIGLRLSVCAN